MSWVQVLQGVMKKLFYILLSQKKKFGSSLYTNIIAKLAY